MLSSSVFLICLHIVSSQNATTSTQSPVTPSPTRFIVLPTSTNSSGQYWIATNSYQFENGYIYCETSICYIHCNAPYSCRYTNIFCQIQSSNCTIQCNQNESCHSTNITSMSSSTILLCSSKNACLTSTIAISSSIITVKCLHQQSCSSTYFNLISNKNHNENITIECSNSAISVSNNYSACHDAVFNIHSANSVHIKCGNYDCYSTVFNASNILYNMNMECFSKYACNKAIIDAKFTNKLSLKCDADSSCKSTMVYCPNDINSCNIHCKNDYNSSCESLDIYVANMDVSPLDLTCDTNNNGIKTCYQLEMFCGSGEDQIASYMLLSNESDRYECSDSNCCPLGAGVPLITPRQKYILFLCIGGLFILCCTTIIMCRKKRTMEGLKHLTRREKNLTVTSQYTRMSDWNKEVIEYRPNEAQTISEMKETDESGSNESSGYKSLK